MVRLRDGKTIPQLAQVFGLSERTIHRIIKRVNGHYPLRPTQDGEPE